MRSVFQAFANIRLKAKIWLGFGLVLAIMAFVGGAGYYGVADIGHDVDGYAERVADVDAASSVDREFLNYRRLVREVSASANLDNAASNASAQEARVRQVIERAAKEISNDEGQKKVQDLNARFVEYAALANKASALTKEKDNIGNKVFDEDGNGIRADLEDLAKKASADGNSEAVALSNEALRRVLEIQLDANLMLGRQNTNLKDAVNQAFATMDVAVTSLAEISKNTDEVRDLADLRKRLEEYRAGYERAVLIDDQLDEIQAKALPTLAGEIGADTEQIRDAAAANEHKDRADAVALIASTEELMLLSVASGVCIGALLAWIIGRGIANPIRATTEVLLALADGNTSIEVPYTERTDEVGENARAAQAFKDNLIRIDEMEIEKRAAERRAAEQRRADMNALADQFQGAVGLIVETVAAASSQLESAAGALTKTAETTQGLSTMVAAASEQTSTNVQGVAAASEELSSTVLEISRQVQESSVVADEAVQQATRTNTCVMELSQSASRIGHVVNLISTIANQTNLLALNATIEAARAGEAGKGFAVVAQEVKALAAQTGKATSEIAGQISSMQAATADAVAAIKEITGTISRISDISGAIAAAVEQQGETTKEISRNVAEAAKGTSEVAMNITDVSKGASDTGGASSQVLSSAKQLSADSNRLRHEVVRFLANVRSA